MSRVYTTVMNILLTTESGSTEYRGLEKARTMSPAAVIDEIEAARLLGRGGASFPAARKWRIAAEHDAALKHVVANGGEHEPGSNKDKHLVARYPHKVLEGLAICAYATGAEHAWIYLIEDMAEQIGAIETALDEARNAKLLDLDVRIHRAPTTYVAGEETAAIDSIDGGQGKPRAKPPYPGESGIGGAPTTVNNVETLAHAAWILREGSARFRAIGTEGSTGTMLFTLGDEVERPGVYELPFGATYRELIEGCGGGTRGGRAIRALLPALSCAFIGPDQLDLPISHETLRAAGSSPGCGGVHLLLEGDDVLERTLEIARFFMREQCGQCPPCRMETNQLVHMLEATRAGTKGDLLGQMKKIAGFTRGKGNCSLIEMAAAPVLSAVAMFPAEFGAGGDQP